MKRLDASAQRIPKPLRGVLVGLAEAFEITRLFPNGVPQDGYHERGRDLRLHVGGDVANALVVRALAHAAKGWNERGGGRVWTYTHRWRSIPRAAWGRIAALASVETARARSAAKQLGYASAITLPEFVRGTRSGSEPGNPDSLVVYCPHEEQVPRLATQPNKPPVTCVGCGLCMRGHQNIGFLLHGTDADAGRRSVAEVLNADREVHRLTVLEDH